MAIELGKGYVQIVPSAKGIKGLITKEMSPEAKSAGEASGAGIGMSLVSKLTGVVAVAGLGKVIGDSITQGGKLQQSLGGVETLFKKNADIVKKNAEVAFKTAGVSANTYMENVTSFSASMISSLGGDTKKAANYANTAMIDMSDNANKMGTNIEDIQNAYQGFAKSNFSMLDNLKLGYGGTRSEMQRLLNDASKISGQKYDISSFADITKAIHVIQDQMNITGTTSREAATTFEGSLGSMKAAASDFMGNLALGKNIGPSLQNLVDTTGTFLFGNLMPMVGNVLSGIGTALVSYAPSMMAQGMTLLANLSQGFQTGLPQLVAKIPQIFGQLMSSLSANMPTIISKGFEIITNLALGIMNAIPVLIGSIPKMINSFAQFLVTSYPVFISKGFEMILKLADGIAKAIPKIIVAVAKIIPQVLVTLATLPFKLFSVAAKAVAKMASGFKPATVVGAIGKLIVQIGTNIGKLPGKVWNFVKSIPSKLAKAFNFHMPDVLGIVSRTLRGLPDKVWNFVKGIPAKLKSAFNFKWSLPHLNLPHLSVSGGKPPFGIGGKGSLPSFSIKWYRKAMDNPYMFENATLFGAGEAGDEIIYGRNNLMRDIREASSGKNSSDDIKEIIRSLAPIIVNAVVEALKNLKIEVDKRELGRVLRKV